jgi:hypothetical protein
MGVGVGGAELDGEGAGAFGLVGLSELVVEIGEPEPEAVLEAPVEVAGAGEVVEGGDGVGGAVFADGEAGVEEVAEGDGAGEGEALGLEALELLRGDEVEQQQLLEGLGDAAEGGGGVELGEDPFGAPVGGRRSFSLASRRWKRRRGSEESAGNWARKRSTWAWRRLSRVVEMASKLPVRTARRRRSSASWLR